MRAGLVTLVWMVCLLVGACEEPVPLPVGQAVRYESTGEPDGVRFKPVEIHLDAGRGRVAAYQVELKVVSGHGEIVGVEGSDRPGFEDAPYYDPAALTGGRIIIAAFSTDHQLPAGSNRVATVHMREAGQAKVVYELELTAAADGNGNPIKVSAFLTGNEGGTR
jgi:hypothetical protein